MNNPNTSFDSDNFSNEENADIERLSGTASGFKDSPIPTIGVSSTGIIRCINEAALTEFFFDRETMLNTPFFNHFIDQSADRSEERLPVNNQPVNNREFTILSAGERKWVLLSSMVPANGDDLTYMFIRDVTRYKKKENLFLYLNQAAASLARTRDMATALQKIAEFIVPSFADWFTIDVVNGDGLDLILLKHEDPLKIEWAYQYRKKYPPNLNSNAGASLVLKTGKPGFVPKVTEEMIDLSVTNPVQREEVKKIGLHSVIIAPMLTDSKVTGLVNFISSRSDQHFDEDDLDFALNFASLISIALENTRLNEEAAAVNEEITARNEELSAANEELESANEEQAATNEELIQTQQDLQHTVQQLEASRRHFQSMLDSIPQIAWTSSPEGDVEYYNQRWYDYTGLSVRESTEQGWGHVIHPDDLGPIAEIFAKLSESKEPGEFEVREKGADGVYRWHLVRMLPLFGSTGQLEKWIGTATEIDELKRIQQQKDDFISIASHELKTPLTTLRASIQLLYNMKSNPSADKFSKLIEQANRSLYKMSTLVEDLLNVNRLKGTQLELRKEWFNLSELVNACCNYIAVAGKHEIVIVGDKMLKVCADERTIDQVVVNFVNNAVKYAPLAKEIRISIENKQGGAKLSVQDYGPGIPPEQLPFIFNRYYQAGKTDYRNPGLGLGLYICSEIIKRHKGDIGVDSEPGIGSTFWFTLPDVKY
jgi:PAS domain S-box-containing protein